MTGPEVIKSILDCRRTGDLLQAEYLCNEVIKAQPDNAEILHLLGVIDYQRKDYAAAIEHISKAVELRPDSHDAYNNLGAVLKEIGQHDEAVQCYKKAIDLRHNYPEAYNNMGMSLKERGRHEEAERCYRNAIQYKPDFYEAYNNLGILFKDMERLDEAAECFLKAVQINPRYADAYNNLGGIFQEKGEPGKSVAYYRKAIEVDPDHSCAHWNLSLALLLTGDFSSGWREYEWRWKAQGIDKRNFPQAIWDGSDIKGRTVLLHAEQGFGDTIQFIRYARLVARLGAEVIVECRKELKPLLKSVSGVRQAIERGEALPSFDVHCPILSLPLLFGTTTGSIPADIPYIAADPVLVGKWHEKAGISGFRVGLVWAGKPAHTRDSVRSCTLGMFSPFARLKDVVFFSLQKGEAAQQAGTPPEGIHLVDFSGGLEDFSDTAALIENLDLVVSVDTAVAHLAGAMGKPVWVLVPYAPDWRWLLDREDSPWYHSMRLFRQSSAGDWRGVIERITEELARTRSCL